jgi:hypothetical protein
MTNNYLSKGLKAILLTFIIAEAFAGLGFLFFQHLLEGVYGAKFSDPEMIKLFGAALVTLSYLFILGLKSKSVDVIRPMLKAYLLYNILILAATYYNFTSTAMQPLIVYANVGITHSVLLVLNIWGLIISKK